MSTEPEEQSISAAEILPIFLVVGGEPFREQQRSFLGRNDLAVEVAEDVAGVIHILGNTDIEGVLVEFSGSPAISLDVIDTLRRLRPLLPVVVASAHPSVGEAVRIMQLGVDSYVAIPGQGPREPTAAEPAILDSISRILRRRRASMATDRAERPAIAAPDPGLIGRCDAMQTLLGHVALVAPTKTTVLILGETGSGKERIAQAIHQGSPRRKRAFVAVNCGALSKTLLETELFGHERGAFTGAHSRREGRFMMADGGTLFLDEVGELSLALQVKLLRVLQERRFERVGGSQSLSVDVRVIAATNRDLGLMVKEGSFRPDLFYRLNVMVLHVPALRQRPGDLAPLMSEILGRLSLELGMPVPEMSAEIMEAIVGYQWPGNIRELENVLERLMVMSRGRRPAWNDLPSELRWTDVGQAAPALAVLDVGEGSPEQRPPIPGATFRELERYAILRTYESCGHSPSRTAEILGLSLRTVHYRLREYRGVSGRRKATVLASVPPENGDPDET